MDIRFKYKQILDNLYASRDGLQLFTIYRRFNLAPSRVVDFVNEFTASDIISIDDSTTVSLTSKGRDNIRQIISDLFKDGDFFSSTYLEKRKYIPMGLYDPYIPTEILKQGMDEPLFDYGEFALPF